MKPHRITPGGTDHAGRREGAGTMSYDQAEYERAIRVGAGLISDGENPEYDRGVAELLGDLFAVTGMPLDERRDAILAELRGLRGQA